MSESADSTSHSVTSRDIVKLFPALTRYWAVSRRFNASPSLNSRGADLLPRAASCSPCTVTRNSNSPAPANAPSQSWRATKRLACTEGKYASGVGVAVGGTGVGVEVGGFGDVVGGTDVGVRAGGFGAVVGGTDVGDRAGGSGAVVGGTGVS